MGRSYPKDDPRMRETNLGQMGARLGAARLRGHRKWAKSMGDEPGAYRVMENLNPSMGEAGPACCTSGSMI